MSSVPPAEIRSLSIATARQVDAACDCLEESLRAGQPGRVEDYLAEVEESAQPALLKQLLLLEWDYRQQRGERVDLADYLARFPQHSTLIRQISAEHTLDLEAESGSGASAAAGPRGSTPSAYSTQAWSKLGYLILGRLGRGGMGMVYLACQTAADRLVAVKVLQDGVDHGPAGFERFRREAHTLARLQHPHIVPVFEVGQCQGRPFYSMEYCPGGSLAEHLQGTRLSGHEAAALLETIAWAAHAAHQAGVVHRDLKPSNVLLSGPPAPGAHVASPSSLAPLIPKLADFGLAKKLDATAQTQTGAVLGTPQYMAPEQARGESKSVGVTADVYALGAILYECLTDQPPFVAATPLETMMQVISIDAVPPSQLQPNVPRDLETICLTCLHKEPHHRYADAAALAEDLRRFLAGEPILARPVGAWDRACKWMKRYPAATALLGVLFISIMVLIVAAWALEERTIALTARDAADAQRLRAQRRFALITKYDQALSVGEIEGPAGAMLRLAQSLSEAVAAEEPELEESFRQQLAAWSRDFRSLKRIVLHADIINAVAFSPDGQTLLTGSNDQTARIWQVATGQPIGPPLQHRGKVFAAAFSPDGETLLTGCGDGTAQLWEAATGKPLGPPLEHRNRVLAVAFSPNGQTVVTGSHDTTARLWETATGKPVGQPLEHQGIVRSVAFSRDGTLIATACDDKTAQLWDAATCRRVGPPLEHQERVVAVAFSPDGKRVITGSGDRTAQMWVMATGQRIGQPLEHENEVFAVAFSPDGKTILTGCDDYKARLWDASTGNQLVPPLQHHDKVRSVAFSPDGQTVLTGCFDGGAPLWDVALDPPRQHNSWVYGVAFSPDGKTVLTGSADNSVRLWEVGTWKPRDPILKHQTYVRAAAFSPDGKTILTASDDKTAQLWDTATGKPLSGPMEHPDKVWAAAFSPDGRTIVTGCWDNTARLWRVGTAVPVGPPLEHHDRVYAVAFSPDGKVVLTGSGDTTAQQWVAATGLPLGPPLKHQIAVRAVAFSPDGKTILTGSQDRKARLWEAATGQPLGLSLQHPGMVLCVAFSPDGKIIATGSDDNTVQLWETATRKRLGPPMKHQGFVVAVAFSPDGRRLVSGSEDKTARLWEVFPPVEGDPEWINLWTQVVTGMELDELGGVRYFDAPTWRDRTAQLIRLGGFPNRNRP